MLIARKCITDFRWWNNGTSVPILTVVGVTKIYSSLAIYCNEQCLVTFPGNGVKLWFLCGVSIVFICCRKSASEVMSIIRRFFHPLHSFLLRGPTLVVLTGKYHLTPYFQCVHVHLFSSHWERPLWMSKSFSKFSVCLFAPLIRMSLHFKARVSLFIPIFCILHNYIHFTLQNLHSLVTAFSICLDFLYFVCVCVCVCVFVCGFNGYCIFLYPRFVL